MSDDQPQSKGRRKFFRQFLASAVEGVEDLSKELNHVRQELERQRRSWAEPARYDPPSYTPPERYGPPWPPPYGPPTPAKIRPRLRQLERYYYHNGPHPDGEPAPYHP